MYIQIYNYHTYYTNWNILLWWVYSPHTFYLEIHNITSVAKWNLKIEWVFDGKKKCFWFLDVNFFFLVSSFDLEIEFCFDVRQFLFYNEKLHTCIRGDLWEEWLKKFSVKVKIKLSVSVCNIELFVMLQQATKYFSSISINNLFV